jgi:hypothetical protein
VENQPDEFIALKALQDAGLTEGLTGFLEAQNCRDGFTPFSAVVPSAAQSSPMCARGEWLRR